jgi:hypothetical protein
MDELAPPPLKISPIDAIIKFVLNANVTVPIAVTICANKSDFLLPKLSLIIENIIKPKNDPKYAELLAISK